MTSAQQSNVTQYMRTQVLTASKEQLMLMLYDGLLRFLEQAKVKIDEKNIEGSYDLLIRSKRILTELICGLDFNVDQLLCQRLESLYNYCYRRLIVANIKKDKKAIDEVVTLLGPLRDTWAQAIEKSKAEQPAAVDQEHKDTNVTLSGPVAPASLAPVAAIPLELATPAPVPAPAPLPRVVPGYGRKTQPVNTSSGKTFEIA